MTAIFDRTGTFALGTAGIGNLYEPVGDERAHATLEAAWQAGVRYFDTAPHYGLGLAERRLGAFLATKPRSEFVVSTKVGRRLVPNPAGEDALDDEGYAVPARTRREWDFSPGGIRRCLDESLHRLGLDAVDVLYLHDPDEYDPDAALATGLPAIARLRAEGVVRAAGVGSKSTAALLAAARSGVPDVLLVAGRFTLLEQPAAAELLPECLHRAIDVANAGVFNSGLLATPEPAAGARYEYRPAPADVLERAREIATVCASFGVDLPTAALHYSLREEVVRTIVVGAAAPEEVWCDRRRLATPVPPELWTALRDKGLTRR